MSQSEYTARIDRRTPRLHSSGRGNVVHADVRNVFELLTRGGNRGNILGSQRSADAAYLDGIERCRSEQPVCRGGYVRRRRNVFQSYVAYRVSEHPAYARVHFGSVNIRDTFVENVRNGDGNGAAYGYVFYERVSVNKSRQSSRVQNFRLDGNLHVDDEVQIFDRSSRKITEQSVTCAGRQCRGIRFIGGFRIDRISDRMTFAVESAAERVGHGRTYRRPVTVNEYVVRQLENALIVVSAEVRAKFFHVGGGRNAFRKRTRVRGFVLNARAETDRGKNGKRQAQNRQYR